MIGATVGSYRVTRPASATAAWASSTSPSTRCIGRRAAVKVLLPELLAQPGDRRSASSTRRARPPRSRHPGIVEVFDFGYTADGHAYIVMEFLEGESLAARLHSAAAADRRRRAARSRAAVSRRARARRTRKGIVHRDLKPDNIFLVARSATSPRGERVEAPRLRHRQARRRSSRRRSARRTPAR